MEQITRDINAAKAKTKNNNIFPTVSGVLQSGALVEMVYRREERRTLLCIATEDKVLYETNIMEGGAATSTKHIFANGIMIATIQNASGTTTSTVRYLIDDHLGGANLITDASGTIVETLDYYPYGGLRIDNKTGGYSGEKRKYIGQMYDSGSGLDYLNARYYDSNRAQFTSLDPVFSDNPKGQKLDDPQSLNSYSYSEGNPIIKSDPTGKCPDGCFIEIGIVTSPEWAPPLYYGAVALAGALYVDAVSTFAKYNNQMRERPFEAGKRLVSGVSQPSIFGSEPPKLPNGPNWKTIFWVGVATIGAVTDIYSAYNQYSQQVQQYFSNSTNNSQQGRSNGQNPAASKSNLSATNSGVANSENREQSSSRGSSLGQLISNLYNALVQLSATIASYGKK